MTSTDVHMALTFDFDSYSTWIGSHRATSPSMLSRGEFDLSVFHFMKRSLIAYLCQATYQRLAPAAWTFALYGGFMARANSVLEICDRIFSNSSPFTASGARAQ